jgi:hypothetical protein
MVKGIGVERTQQALQLDKTMVGDPSGLDGTQRRLVDKPRRRRMPYNDIWRPYGGDLASGPT